MIRLDRSDPIIMQQLQPDKFSGIPGWDWSSKFRTGQNPAGLIPKIPPIPKIAKNRDFGTGSRKIAYGILFCVEH